MGWLYGVPAANRSLMSWRRYMFVPQRSSIAWIKELLESGEDVYQSDEVLVFFSLCKSNVMPDLSRSLYLRILFVHSE